MDGLRNEDRVLAALILALLLGGCGAHVWQLVDEWARDAIHLIGACRI